MKLRFLILTLPTLALVLTAACSSNQSPDQLREKTAEATSALKQDTKAVAEGVKEGLGSKPTAARKVNLNTGSKDDLSALPGITARSADRIIAERPYASSHQLVTRHIISEAEYAHIRDQIVVVH
jgi:DNA uptake protein ComE-like DNA-binding protein